MLLTLFNGLIGAVCGIWFRVQVLLPLIVVALVEVPIASNTGTWSSTIWLAIALVVSIEVGYLAGASAAALWSASNSKKIVMILSRVGPEVCRLSERTPATRALLPIYPFVSAQRG